MVAIRYSLPHARGGVSATAAMLVLGIPSSPCTWGCFSGRATFIASAVTVFPMHVGVFLRRMDVLPFKTGLPHARGGVSTVDC